MKTISIRLPLRISKELRARLVRRFLTSNWRRCCKKLTGMEMVCSTSSSFTGLWEEGEILWTTLTVMMNDFIAYAELQICYINLTFVYASPALVWFFEKVYPWNFSVSISALVLNVNHFNWASLRRSLPFYFISQTLILSTHFHVTFTLPNLLFSFHYFSFDSKRQKISLLRK